MIRINTALTRLLDIRVPVVCAPMANVGGASLVSQVTIGGGFGFIPAGYSNARWLQDELASARSMLKSEPSDVLRVGVGYLGWKLNEEGSSALEMLDIALRNNAQAVWLAFGNDLGRWINYVRQSDVKRGTSRKTLIFVQVNSLEEALVAVNDWKVDVLVAQGNESGGHGGGYAPPTFSLVSSILGALTANGPPLLAAGGLSNGSQVAAYLTLGAAGAVLGTRFLLTPESKYTDSQKNALLFASSSSTVRTLAFDRARSTLGWPAGIDGRGLRNKLVEDIEKGVDIKIVQENFQKAMRRGDPDYSIIWAGQGVGDVTEIKGAQNIVQDIERTILQRLQASQMYVQDVAQD